MCQPEVGKSLEASSHGHQLTETPKSCWHECLAYIEHGVHVDVSNVWTVEEPAILWIRRPRARRAARARRVLAGSRAPTARAADRVAIRLAIASIDARCNTQKHCPNSVRPYRRARHIRPAPPYARFAYRDRRAVSVISGNGGPFARLVVEQSAVPDCILRHEWPRGRNLARAQPVITQHHTAHTHILFPQMLQ
eukprot:COSAG02_NODE_2416_length_8909_cov_10.038252_9_plen_194_part_00